VTVLWIKGVQTDREVQADGPDPVIKNKEDKICMLIDVATCSDRNVAQTEAEK
jgi:hypothetical protein